MKKNKCVFLDRDGVINVDPGFYTYQPEKLLLENNVVEALGSLSEQKVLIIVITNQAGIAKGIYGHEDVVACHHKIQQLVGNTINAFYYSPYHPEYTNSLSRKPESLLFEKAITRYDIDVKKSWMVGDKERDLMPAKKVGVSRLIKITNTHENDSIAHYQGPSLYDAVINRILPEMSKRSDR